MQALSSLLTKLQALNDASPFRKRYAGASCAKLTTDPLGAPA